MKQLRVKLVGLGLAVLAGSALAADEGPQPADSNKKGPDRVVQTYGETGSLQPTIQSHGSDLVLRGKAHRAPAGYSHTRLGPGGDPRLGF